MFKRILSISLIIIYTITILWAIYLHTQEDTATAWNYLFNGMYSLLYFFGGATGLYGLWKYGIQTTLGKMFGFLGLGLASYGIGLLVWLYYNLVSQVEIPYPSVADILFIPFFISLIAMGLMTLLPLFTAMIKRKHILGVLGIFPIILFLTLIINRPEVSKDLPMLTNITNIAYPAGDSILLSLAILTFIVCGGKLHRGIFIFAFGLLFQVIADFAFTYRTNHELYWNGDISDILFSTSGFVLSLGLLTIYHEFSEDDTVEATG